MRALLQRKHLLRDALFPRLGAMATSLLRENDDRHLRSPDSLVNVARFSLPSQSRQSVMDEFRRIHIFTCRIPLPPRLPRGISGLSPVPQLYARYQHFRQKVTQNLNMNFNFQISTSIHINLRMHSIKSFPYFMLLFNI